mmetsp:Transcript_11856/g.32069  ORF Transcript_11856/g.32069 Transcript_11856/m.32069 type:complete len:321 (-) Transcript_11856:4536-5498(-)
MDKDGEKRGMQKGIYSAHLRKAPCPLSALLISSLHLQFFTPSKLSSERLGFPITLSSSTFNPFAIMLNFWLRLLFMSCMKLRMVDISPSKPSMRRRRRLGLGPDALSRFAYASDTFRLDSPFSSFPLAVVPRGRSCSSDEKSSSTSNKRSTSFAVNCALSSTTTSCLATTFSVIASTRLSSRRCSSLPLGLMESGLKNCLKRSPSTVRSSVCGSSFLSVHAWVRSSGSSDGTTLLVLSFSSSSTAVVLPSAEREVGKEGSMYEATTTKTKQTIQKNEEGVGWGGVGKMVKKRGLGREGLIIILLLSLSFPCIGAGTCVYM